MFHFVYVLESKSKTNQIYIGYYPENVHERVEKHNRGEVFSTKPYRPWELIFYEAYSNQEDALRRERYLKTNQGSRALKFMLRKYREHSKKPDSKA